MTAGVRLDRLIGERVLACRIRRHRSKWDGEPLCDLVVPGSYNRVDYLGDDTAWAGAPKVSTDPVDCKWMVERLRKKGWTFTMLSGKDSWWCLAIRPDGHVDHGHARTMEHAVALAVLEAANNE